MTRYLIVIHLLLCFTARGQLRTDSSLSYLCINLKVLNEKEKAEIVNAFAKYTTRQNILNSFDVEPANYLNGIIKQEYKYNHEKNKLSYFELKNQVMILNNIKNEKDLRAGKKILLPVVPKQPKEGSSYAYMQYYDLTDSLAVEYKPEKLLSSYFISSFEKKTPSVPSHEAALSTYKLKASEIDSLLNYISPDVFESIKGRGISVMHSRPPFVEVTFPQTENNVVAKNTPFSMIELFKNIDSKNFGEYYVLDFFSDTCEHGDKVLNVIESNLAMYGLSIANIKLKKVPINFFANQDKCLSLLEEWFNCKYCEEDEEKLWIDQGRNQIEWLKNNREFVCKTCVPEVYLNAAMKYCYDQNPDIISTSFFVTAYDNNCMPHFNACNTNLITAGLNEPGKKIEDLLKPYHKPGSRKGAPEPIFSYFTNYSSIGSLIVGCYIDKSNFTGMYSNGGDRVSVLGIGKGWTGSCIRPTNEGCSFSTPDVGIHLYLAKAYWKSKLLDINAIEARVRLLLAVNLNELFVGKFAAGGLININKLVQTGKAYVELIDGTIKEVEVIQPSLLTYEGGSLPFQRDSPTSVATVSGLYHLSEGDYVFLESKLKWQKVKLTGLNIITKIDNRIEVLNTIEGFTTKFKQIVILTN